MLRVVSATGLRLSAALEVMYSALPAEERAARIAESTQAANIGELDLSNLLLAEFDGEPVGALLLRMQTNETGFVWPPVIVPKLLAPDAAVAVSLPSSPSPCGSEDSTISTAHPGHKGLGYEAIEDALLQEAARRLDQLQAWIGQSLLESSQSRERAALSRNGFTFLTDLKFFEHSVRRSFQPLRSLDQTRSANGLKNRPTFVPYRQARNRQRFVHVIEQTYRGSQDCPEMNGLRSARQSLQTHEASGPFKSGMWRLYHSVGVDVGVLLAVDRPEQQAWEVIYLGVVEAARRRGIARDMLLDIQQAAGDAGVERLLIVVDARNLPAVRLYESLGFTMYDVRAAHMRLRH
jgi:GNAT superfamily N-acetyltransferase